MTLRIFVLRYMLHKYFFFENSIWLIKNIHQYIIHDINLVNSFMTEALSYRNQSIDLLRKSMYWFLYDNGLCHERVNSNYVMYMHIP